LPTGKALVEREFTRNLLPSKDENKISNFFATAKALVARNFYGIYFRKKGTVK